MELKSKKVSIINKNNKELFSLPTRFKIHWDKKLGEYVLCHERLFSYSHYSLEEINDMKRILTKFIQEVK